jgi:hypothetical protein
VLAPPIVESFLSPTSHLSSAPVSYPIPRDNHVAAPFAQAGFSARGSAHRSPSHHASTPGFLERLGTHPSGTLPRRSLQRVPLRCRGVTPPEPPSPQTRRGASSLLPVCGLPPRYLPPLSSAFYFWSSYLILGCAHDATLRSSVPPTKDHSPECVECVCSDTDPQPHAP